MGRKPRELTGYDDLEEVAEDKKGGKDKTLAEDATDADFRSVGVNGNGSLSTEMPPDKLANEITLSEMDEEDTRIFEKLVIEDPSLTLVASWLNLINGTIQGYKARGKVIASIPFRISSPALVAYVNHKGLHKAMRPHVAGVLKKAMEDVHEAMMRPFEIDQRDCQVFAEADNYPEREQ